MMSAYFLICVHKNLLCWPVFGPQILGAVVAVPIISMKSLVHTPLPLDRAKFKLVKSRRSWQIFVLIRVMPTEHVLGGVLSPEELGNPGLTKFVSLVVIVPPHCCVTVG